MPSGTAVTEQFLHGRLVEELGSRLVAGDPPAGHRFTTAWVESEFAVSRSVAREAIRVLESLGMVRNSRRIGCTVQPPSSWNTLDPHLIRWQLSGPNQAAHLRAFTELRAALEPQAAALAAQRASREQSDRLVRTAALMADLGGRELGDSEDFLAADVEFHATVMAASSNPAFVALVPTLTACLVGRNDEGLTPAQPDTANLHHHIALAEAIKVGDVAAAVAAATSLVTVVTGEIT